MGIPEWEEIAIPEGFGPHRLLYNPPSETVIATTGDFVLTDSEVNPAIAELRNHQIPVTALHSQMLTEQPRLFFIHFWAVGAPEAVGAGIKAALSRVSVK